MFGHKDGKVEARLKDALRDLDELRVDIEKFEQTDDRRNLLNAKNNVAALKLNIENLITLSQKIHDLVEREL